MLCARNLLLDFLQIFQEIKQTKDKIRPPFLETSIKQGGIGPNAGNVIYTPPRGADVIEKKLSNLIDFLNDDGMQIEPEWFMPVLPMVLVNGCEGIGTGYSTYIPPYNPQDIVANLLRVLDDKEPLQMTPYFKHFNGDLRETEPGSYITTGKWQRVSDTQIKITELPVGSWVTTYKEFLEALVENKPKTTKSAGTGGTTKSKKPSVQLKDVYILKVKIQINQLAFE